MSEPEVTSVQDLEAMGAYLNAGFVDHYDGYKHTRLCQVSSGGDVLWEPGGREYANALHLHTCMSALSSEVPELPELPVTPVDPAPTPPVEADPVA